MRKENHRIWREGGGRESREREQRERERERKRERE
jgi:hypothetical protein